MSYSSKVIDHYENPRHHGTIEHADISHEESNPLCGDKIRVDVKLSEDGAQIEHIAFSGDGCIISQAAASMLMEDVAGKSVADVQKLPFSDSVEGLGTLRANESVTLTATVTKTITAVNFEDGQRVKAGTVLVEMNRRQEKAQLAQERASLAEAQRQLERIEPLVKEGAASAALLDQRQREYKTAQARLAEIQSRLHNPSHQIPVDPFRYPGY